MIIGLYLLLFFLGAAAASFVNLAAARRNKILGRSVCDGCGRKLSWLQLFPIIGYFIHLGRCRHCTVKISYWHPISEAFLGLIFVFIVYLNLPLILNFSLAIVLFYLLTYDYHHMILPDMAILVVAIIGISQAYFFRASFLPDVITALLVTLPFGILYMFSRGSAMGLGDVKLIFAISLVLGYPWAPLSVIASIWLATLCGLILVAFKKATFKSALPFGTFLTFTTILVITFQNEFQIINRIF